MDKEYLQNIAGSPHVNEGLGDRILARGASGLQRVSAMTGGDIQDLNHRKVNTLFTGFINKLTGLLKDFAEGPHSVANRLQQMQPPISGVQRDTIEQIRDLYSSLVPSTFQQHQVGQSILNPRSNRSALTELLKEGIFTRDMGLNKALQTNNPTTILNAYLAEIKRAYDTFIRDAMKVTGAPKDFVKRVVSGLDKKWAPILTKVENVANLTNAQQQSGQAATAAAPGTVPPVIDPNAAGAVAATSPAQAQASPQDQPAPEPKSSEEDYVMIVINVCDIIINAVKGDEERAAPYFKPGEKQNTYEPLPADWDALAITKEAEEPEQKEDAPEGEKNEFLYNFHSLYRKQRHFAIEIPQDGQFTYTNRVKKQLNKVDVVWSNNQHENNIYVKHTPVKKEKNAETQEDELTPTGKSGDVLILKFWDDQVNPRNSQAKAFNIQDLLTQANKNAESVLNRAPNSLAHCGRDGTLEFACSYMVWCHVHEVDDFLAKIRHGMAAVINKE